MFESQTLEELANSYGSDKGSSSSDWGVAHRYTEIYERFLLPRRRESLRLLELGVWKGASLRMWEDYLPNAMIVGIDNLTSVAEIPFARSKAIVGDVTNREFLKSILSNFPGGQVDIIIDDASHVLDQQIATFELLFPYLSEDGIYFVEDVSGSRFGDGNRGVLPYLDFSDYATTLSRQTTFFPNSKGDTYHNITDTRQLSDRQRSALRSTDWNRCLFAVHIYHDLCVFEKKTRVPATTVLPAKQRQYVGKGNVFLANRWRDNPGGRRVALQVSASRAEEALRNLEALLLRWPEASSGDYLTHLITQLRTILKDLAKMERDNRALRLRVRSMRRAAKALELRANLLESKRVYGESEILRLESELESARCRLRQQETEQGQHLAERIAELERERTESAAELELVCRQSRLELQEKAIELARLQEDDRTQRTMIGKLWQLCSGLRATVNSLESRFKSSEMNLAQLLAREESTQSRSRLREHELQVLRNCLQGATAQLEWRRTMIQQLSVENAALQKQLSIHSAPPALSRREHWLRATRFHLRKKSDSMSQGA